MPSVFVKRALCVLGLCLGAGSVAAQPAPWAEALPVVITEHSGAALIDHQVPIVIDTQQLIAEGRLRADAADLRFGADLAGATIIPHWVESGINTPNTVVWLRVPAIPASGEVGVYLFIGNAAAADTSTLTVFDYQDDIANSATQQTANTSLSGSSNAQRGFRFSVNEELLMVGLGKNEPSSNPRTVTLFDVTTQAVLEQQAIPGPSTQWSYQPLPQPRWLTPGNQYLLEIFFPAGDDAYYFGAAPTVNPRITYHDMRYCNGCTPSTFPNNSLGGMLYGYVDFQFRTRKQASSQPTAALGIAGSTTMLAADVNPSIHGTTVTLTATLQSSFDTAGTVTFNVDGVQQCVVPVAAGSAACAVGGLALGTHPAEAVYSGNTFVAGSTGTLSLDVLGPEVAVTGNSVDIAAGDLTPEAADHTDFGQTAVAGGSVVREFIVANTGTSDLSISSVTLGGADAADFAITAMPASPVAPNGSTALQITFDPSAAGLRTATVELASDDEDENPFVFAVQGTGLVPEIAVSGNGLDIADGDATPGTDDGTGFGSVALHAANAVRTFTIENLGGGDLSIGQVLILGAEGQDFLVSVAPATTVPAGGSTTLQIAFDPSAIGVRNATVSIENGDADEHPFTFDVQGSGIGADVQAAISNFEDGVYPGRDTVYVIQVLNAGPGAVSSVMIVDDVPEASLANAQWTCTSTPVGLCPNAGGGPDINETTGELPEGALLEYNLVATPVAAAPGNVSNTVAATNLDGGDPVPDNNTATDEDPILPDTVFSDGFEEAAVTMLRPPIAR